MNTNNNTRELSDADISNLMNAPMLISDATSMYRTPIKDNTPPYQRSVISYFNKRVDEWGERVLYKLSDNSSRINAGVVHPSWSAFMEGKDFEPLMAHLAPRTSDCKEDSPNGMIPVIEERIAMYWINLFKTRSVDELVLYGITTLELGWQVLMQALRQESSRQKYELVFGQSDDPSKWYSLANHNSQLMLGKILPFGLTPDIFNGMLEKFTIIRQSIPKPRSN